MSEFPFVSPKAGRRKSTRVHLAGAGECGHGRFYSAATSAPSSWPMWQEGGFDQWDIQNSTQQRLEWRPWNAGRVVGAKRVLKPQQVRTIRFWLGREQRLRDRAQFDLTIDSKLLGCDIVKLRIGDLVSGGRVRAKATVVQLKTGRPVRFELLEAARASIQAWLEHLGGTLDDCIFPSRNNRSKHLSTRQYARLVDEWVTGIGLRREDYGTHSLRRTKAPIIYKATGNLWAVRILLGHTKIGRTVRYLGVDVEDALTLAEHTEV